MQTINLANDENDDWIKKANPEANAEELRIHEQLAKKYKKPKVAKATKQLKIRMVVYKPAGA